MHSCLTHEATTSVEEEIHIIGWQMWKSIKCVTIDGQCNRSRESQVLIGHKPMGVMIIRYGSIDYWYHTLSQHILLYPWVIWVSLLQEDERKGRAYGFRRTNCVSAQMIEDVGWVGTITIRIAWTPSLLIDQPMDHSEEDCNSWNGTPSDLTHHPNPITDQA
jgi:hypothetical protein